MEKKDIMEDKWIKVKDKKPMDREVVICFINCSMVDREKNNVSNSVGCGYISTDISGEEYWAVFHNPSYNYFGCQLNPKIWGEVTHWMPLPNFP